MELPRFDVKGVNDQSFTRITSTTSTQDSTYPIKTSYQPKTTYSVGQVSKKIKQDLFDLRKRHRLLQGWRFSLSFSICSTVIVLVINVIGAIWASTKHDDGIATLYTGSCDNAASYSSGLHILVNLFSTVLLGGSNYCMQCLNAPTREEVDAAHAKHTWLNIGTPNVRNFRYISVMRFILWCLLGLSSLPLHLVYNSVVFRSMDSNIYDFAYVSEGFTRGESLGNYSLLLPTNEDQEYETTIDPILSSYQMYPAYSNSTADLYLQCETDGGLLSQGYPPCENLSPIWNASFCQEMNGTVIYPFPTYGQMDTNGHLKRMQSFFSNQDNTQNVKNLTIEQCLDEYGSTRIVSGYSDVLAIISGKPSPLPDTSLLNINGSVYFAGVNRTTGSDMNEMDIGYPPDDDPPERWLYSWAYGGNHTAFNCPVLGEPLDQLTFADLSNDPTKWNLYGAPVSYCLAQRTEEHCKVQMSLYLMLVVIVCNVGKMCCLVLTISILDEETILTIGDAVSSFLQRPDSATKGRCLMSKTSRLDDPTPKEWTRENPYWIKAASLYRWTISLTFYVATLSAAGFLLNKAIIGLRDFGGGQTVWSAGFGKVDAVLMARTHFDVSATNALIRNVLTANSPQVLFSLLYLTYNALFTSMLQGDEWSRYAYKRAPLRTTHRQGKQRSTYWLHLPLKYGIPLMIVSGILHWTISQSLFVVSVEIYQHGEHRAGDDLLGLGYSPLGIVVVLVIGSIMVLTLVGFSFRKYRPGLPLASSNSLAISAACHRPADDEDAAFLPVMWGEVDDSFGDSAVVGHCCFTSEEVHMPTEGRLYA